MKLYLDNSFLNRPFDDSTIALHEGESDVLSLIIHRVRKGEIQIVNSAVIEFENSRSPFPEAQEYVEQIMTLASEYQEFTESVKYRADELVKTYNLMLLDARHLAGAEIAQVDLFITCDYAIPKRYKGDLHVMTPLTFLDNYEHRS